MGMLTGKHRNRSYLDDYQINEEGKYEFQGTFYRWQEPEKRRGILRTLWICLTGAAILMLAAGCVPAPGVNHVFYLLLPYAAGLACCLWAAMALGRMSAEADPMREYVHRASVGRLPFAYTLSAVFGIFCAAAELVYLAGHAGEGSLFFGILFSLLELLAAILQILGSKRLGKLSWIRIEKESGGSLLQDGENMV